MKVKIIAGKIIPALATTTSMVVGCVGLEIIKFILVRFNFIGEIIVQTIIKYVTKHKPIKVMRNSFMNLALPLWVLCDPVEPSKSFDCEYDLEYLGPVKAIPKGSHFILRI